MRRSYFAQTVVLLWIAAAAATLVGITSVLYGIITGRGESMHDRGWAPVTHGVLLVALGIVGILAAIAIRKRFGGPAA